jgi:uncharacterized protein YecT (DUF1311 family)
MQPRLFAVILFFVPLLNGQQKPQPKTFEDCDKTAKTQVDLTECGSIDYKSANDELNRTYQQLLRKAGGDPAALQKIKAAQSAWLAFRDAQIAALYPAEDKQEYGTVFPMCVNLDLSDLTRQRTKMLDEMTNPVEGDVCGDRLSYPDAKGTPQTPHLAGDRQCRIVDVIATKAGNQYFVDNVKVPDDAAVIDYLRRAEASSPRSCLRLFVPTSVKIRDVEDMNVIATGKMQYAEFHAYIYDEHRDWVSEISWHTTDTSAARSANGHEVPWPDRPEQK